MYGIPKTPIGLLYTLLFLLLACLCFFPFFQGKVLFFGDNLLHIAPAYHFWKHEILAGRLPLWNPYILAGMPFWADPAHSVLSPFNLIFLLLNSIYQSITLLSIGMVTIASMGAYGLGRSFRFDKLASGVMGLGYGFSGVMFEAVNDLNSLVGVALLPWVVATFIFENFHYRRFISWRLALIGALVILAGHTQYAYVGFGIVGLGTIIGVLHARWSLRALVHLGITLGMIAALSAAQWLPTLEFLQLVQRKDQLGAEASTGMVLAALPRLVMPTLYGRWVDGSSWGPQAQLETGLANVNGFVSVSIGGLAMVALLTSKRQARYRKLLWLSGSVCLIALLMALGNNTFFYAAMSWLPGLSHFRSPERWLSVYTLALIVMAGIGLQSPLRRDGHQWGRVIVIIGILSLGGLISFRTWLEPWIITQMVVGYQWVNGVPLAASGAYSLEKITGITQLIYEAGLLGLWSMMGVGWWLWWLWERRKWLAIVAVGTMVVELWFGVRGNLLFVPESLLSLKPAVVDFLQTQGNESRFISTADTQAYTGLFVYFNHLRSQPPFSQGSLTRSEFFDWSRLRKELAILPANTQMSYQLSTAAGYAALLPQAYTQLSTSKRINSVDFGSFTNPRLNDLGVRYIVTGYPADMVASSTSSHFKKVWQQQNTVVYQNKLAKPRFSLESGGKVTVENLLPDHQELQVLSTTSSHLIIRDLWYPGWQAWLDGERVTILPYQEHFRSLSLPAGNHHVLFQYRPWSVYLGLGISLLTAMGIFVYWLSQWARKIGYSQSLQSHD